MKINDASVDSLFSNKPFILDYDVFAEIKFELTLNIYMDGYGNLGMHARA